MQTKADPLSPRDVSALPLIARLYLAAARPGPFTRRPLRAGDRSQVGRAASAGARHRVDEAVRSVWPSAAVVSRKQFFLMVAMVEWADFKMRR